MLKKIKKRFIALNYLKQIDPSFVQTYYNTIILGISCLLILVFIGIRLFIFKSLGFFVFFSGAIVFVLLCAFYISIKKYISIKNQYDFFWSMNILEMKTYIDTHKEKSTNFSNSDRSKTSQNKSNRIYEQQNSSIYNSADHPCYYEREYDSMVEEEGQYEYDSMVEEYYETHPDPYDSTYDDYDESVIDPYDDY